MRTPTATGKDILKEAVKSSLSPADRVEIDVLQAAVKNCVTLLPDHPAFLISLSKLRDFVNDMDAILKQRQQEKQRP